MLDQFLKGMDTEGTWESHGVFTIQREASLQRLGKLQLPRPSAWVLKMVQAAVRLGAPALEIRQEARFTCFEFRPGVKFSIDATENELLNAEPGAGGALEPLLVALRSVGFGQNRDFVLMHLEGSQARALRFEGGDLERRTVHLGAQVEPLLQLHVTRNQGETAEERTELEQYAQVCPIPLLYQKKRIDTLSYPIETPADPTFFRLGLGAATELDREFPVPPGVAEHRRWSLEDRMMDTRFLCLTLPQELSRVGAIFRLTASYRVTRTPADYKADPMALPATCYWIQDGVICDSSILQLNALHQVRLELFISGEGIPTDLSGLRLRELHRYDDLVNRCLAGAGALVRETRKTLKGRWLRPSGVSSMMGAAVGTTIVIAPLVGLGLIPFAVVWAYGSFRIKDNYRADWLESLGGMESCLR